MEEKELSKFIESGILESYVLGDLSPEEEANVIRLSKEHPEVQAEIDRVEKDIESIYQANAAEVPSYIKAAIMEKTIGKSGSSNYPTEGNHQKPWAWIITAIVLGLCAILSLVYMSMIDASNQQKVNQMQGEIAAIQSSCDEQGEILSFITDPASRKIYLAGTELNEDAGALVFYNEDTGKAIFFGQNLPEKADELSFQLWAIIDGVPVDLGLVEQDESGRIISISTSGAVQAFAITIEPEGGSEEPTLDQMLVFGDAG